MENKNYIDSSVVNPFMKIKKFISKPLKIRNEKLNQIYNFEVSVDGVVGDKDLILTTGYKGYSDLSNTFILKEEDIDKLIELLVSGKKILEEDKNVIIERKKQYDTLYEYIDKGYVEKICCNVLSDNLPYGYNELFKKVLISPKFKTDLPQDGINLTFNFVDILLVQPNDNHFKKLNNQINKNSDIEVEWTGYDIEKEKKKIIEKAKRDYQNNIGRSSNLSVEEKLKYIEYSRNNK